jgi:hypothetical protein
MDNISRAWRLREARIDRATKILVIRCDICENPIPGLPDNFELRIDALNEMNDMDEPRLLLCNNCKKQYDIPSWIG